MTGYVDYDVRFDLKSTLSKLKPLLSDPSFMERRGLNEVHGRTLLAALFPNGDVETDPRFINLADGYLGESVHHLCRLLLELLHDKNVNKVKRMYEESRQ